MQLVIRNGLYREILARALRSHEGIVVVGATASCRDAAAVVERRPQTVVLVDVADDDGIEALARLRRRAPEVLVVALGMRDSADDVIAWAEAGIVGYVTRDGSFGELVKAIDGAARGEMACSPGVGGELVRHVARLAEQKRPPEPEPTPLTRREAEILALIDDGLSNKEIACRLVIELPTVKNHVHHILEKLQVDGRAAAAAYLRQGRVRGPRPTANFGRAGN